jgi:hypothetical protein
MAMPYRGGKGERWLKVRDHPVLKGIDYLIVSEDQHTLSVYFIPKKQDDAIPTGLTAKNISITRGTADSGIWVTEPLKTDGNCLTVPVNDSQGNPMRIGNFSIYTLKLVGIPDIDPLFSKIDFSFKINCPQTLDCASDQVCIQPSSPSPRIDYLSKDYASFRQVMLDRMSLVLPDWKERSPADAMIALVEVLAYAVDHLSYYQDAVSTEAYLGTARKRVSVRRHARLLDYHMHDGCNARVWVQIWWNGCDGIELKGPSKTDDSVVHGGTRLLTQVGSMPGLIPQDRLKEALAEGPIVFETMHDITLHEGNREIYFYTWGETSCCLPTGATNATLAIPEGGNEARPVLKVDDVLIFEEISSPETKGPANPAHRHAVRLTSVSYTSEKGKPLTDPLTGRLILEIGWGPNDAMPFPLCISVPDKPRVSVARGNIVLADHGMTFPSDLTPFQTARLESLGEVPDDATFSPALQYGPLTQQGYVRRKAGSGEDMVRYDEHGPASDAFRWEMRDVLPAVLLYDSTAEKYWRPVRDLLASDQFAREFVIETEEDKMARIRFGDDLTGMYPAVQHAFDALYRMGNGITGNIGHDALAHVVLPDSMITHPAPPIIRNPLPASGGIAPESIEKVRLDAPQAFRTQQRAVTTDDYAIMAERHPEIQKAVASRRWTGSWYTLFIAVDRKGGAPVDDDFRSTVLQFLETYRLAAHDIEIIAPSFVPLDIELEVCVLPEYLAADVKERLIAIFSCHILPDGMRGFFHPDNFTFGQAVYLSTIVAAAMQVPGIRWIQVPVLKRWKEPADMRQKDKIEIKPHEIARLDNDPSNIQNGRIVFTMRGGL